MYPTNRHPLLSAIRLAALFAWLLLGAVYQGYGQRVYANSDIISGTYTLLGNGVQNRGNAIGNNHNTSSNIIVSVTGSAWQTLRFTGSITPTSKSPVTIKFQAPTGLLNLLGGLRIQRTNGAGPTLVGNVYTDDQLLELLSLLSGTIYEFQLPAGNDAFDGIRVFMNSTLGLLTTVNYYYAFFIVPPQLTSSSSHICEGELPIFNLAHLEPGYKYRVYTTETNGTHIAESSSSQITLPVPESTGIFTYWVEAVDSDTYISARTPVTVTVHPKPGKPNMIINTIAN